MKGLVKRGAIVLGGVAAVGLLAVIAAPRAVHAVVATLVEVSNPSLSPVQVREVNNGVDELFATTLCGGTTSNCSIVEGLGGLPADSGTSFTVASTDAEGNPVQAMVINYVSGICSGALPGLKRQSAVDPVNGQSQIVNFFSPTASPNSGSEPVIHEIVNIVVPANSTVSIYDPSDTGACYLTINGYYVAQTSKPL